MAKVVMAGALAAAPGCASKANGGNSSNGGKVLVAYFSYSGNTQRAAEKIASYIPGSDIFRIDAAQPYTAADVDWTVEGSRCNKEHENPDLLPELAKKVENIKDYDTFFIGFPIWWYIEPNIINSFIKAHDLRGKRVVPFFTSYSSGPGETDKHLQACVDYPVDWKPAARVNTMSDKQLKAWVSAQLK